PNPVCWQTLQLTVPSNSQVPPTGNHTHRLSIFYQTDGVQTITFLNAASVTLNPGQGALTADSQPHAHVNSGATPFTSLISVLLSGALCTGTPDTLPPGLTRLAITEPLPLVPA